MKALALLVLLAGCACEQPRDVIPISEIPCSARACELNQGPIADEIERVRYRP